MSDPTLVVIGAGPVGLWTAIQFKLRNPDATILIREKYGEFKRRHLLKLDKTSFNNCVKNQDLTDAIDNFGTAVRTIELQQKLLQVAKNLGIEIDYTEVTDCKELSKEFSKTRFIVDASGSHSISRHELWNDEKQVDEVLQYIMELKYEATGKAEKLGIFETLGAQSVTPFLTHEACGRPDAEGKSPVSVRMFIDKETYDEMKEATFRNPYKITDYDKMPKPVSDAIKARLIVRQDHETRIEGSEKISTTTLPVYAAKSFTKKIEDKTWYLVGDAALGVPYFRSLNAGLLCGTELALRLSQELNPQPIEIKALHSKSIFASSTSASSMDDDDKTPTERYEQFMQNTVKSEISTAKWKDTGVRIGVSSAELSYATGVSTSKLTENTRHALADEDLLMTRKSFHTKFDEPTTSSSTGCLLL